MFFEVYVVKAVFLISKIKLVTCGNLSFAAVGSQSLPVATPRSPHLGRPSSAVRGLRADHEPSNVPGLELLVTLSL